MKLVTAAIGTIFAGGAYYHSNNKDSKLPFNQSYFACKTLQNYFSHSLTMIPHPEKKYKGGEDAAYADEGILVVADGVGGWASRGVDPAIYSRNLVKSVVNNWQKKQRYFMVNPKDLIIESQKTVTDLGSSTLVICTIDEENPILRSAYIGDSGYMIFRASDGYNYNLVFESKEQQKSFNFPYQLGYGRNGDSPQASWTLKHEIRDKDIVVVGSDGLFDNFDHKQIQAVLQRYIPNPQEGLSDPQLKNLSDTIANQTYTLSLDQYYNSPFAIKARQARKNFNGGKSDDITVIVAQAHVN